MYGVNVTRINRSGMDLFADPNLVLQVGDRVMVVGQQDAVERVAGVLGNQLKRLDTPNIVTIFVGIFWESCWEASLLHSRVCRHRLS